MAEREYLDYDDWLRAQGLEGTQQKVENPDLYAQPQEEAPFVDPNAWLYDQNAKPPIPPAPGFEWYWNGRQHSQRKMAGQSTPTPTPASGPTAMPTEYGGDYNYTPPARVSLANLNETYPQFSGPRFQAPAPFSFDPFAYEEFKAPTLEEAQNEPGFDYALKQGIKAYENSKAYTGTYRGGATVKGINDYARNMANQNYGQVFERKGQTYDRNRGNAFGNWSANRNNAADAYAMNYGVTRDVFDRDYTAAKDEYAPRARASELQFGRDWDVFAYEGDDAYRRWKALVDANTV